MAKLEGEHVFDRIVDSDAIFWIEKDREFILDGRMYDVVETRERDGRREFLVLPDDRETELLERFLAKSGAGPNSTGYRMPEHNPFSGFWMPIESTRLQRLVGSAALHDLPMTVQNFPSPPFIPFPLPPPLV